MIGGPVFACLQQVLITRQFPLHLSRSRLRFSRRGWYLISFSSFGGRWRGLKWLAAGLYGQCRLGTCLLTLTQLILQRAPGPINKVGAGCYQSRHAHPAGPGAGDDKPSHQQYTCAGPSEASHQASQ